MDITVDNEKCFLRAFIGHQTKIGINLEISVMIFDNDYLTIEIIIDHHTLLLLVNSMLNA